MSDSKLFQKIQDYFCMVNGIYLSCLTKKDGVMREVCQCNDKWKSMLTFIGEEKYKNLLLRLSDCRVENLIDEPLDKDYIRLYGLIVRVDYTHDIYWIIAAVIDEQMSNEERNLLPDGIIITSEARLNRTIEFLETMTRQLLITKRADIALFNAKKEGKNRIEFYNEGIDGTSTKRLDLEKHMRKATMNECDEFTVYFQPIINVKGEDVCAGAEALVRWNSATMGFINPVDFIPLAEYLGLINPIGEHVLREAAKHCRYWNDMGHPDYKVNVNLSVVQLLQNDIVKKIKGIIDEVGIEPGNLCLEVTESLAINDMVRMKRILSEIKALGVKVALDDFGTGYSSLNHIREMPLDIIKIDKSSHLWCHFSLNHL
jgi:EAL domain-containing protein (putative c-di-GMP-specific phosphodiesterase class I)